MARRKDILHAVYEAERLHTRSSTRGLAPRRVRAESTSSPCW